MLTFKGKQVYLACGHTDGRKQINGLASLVESSFNLDLFGDAVFVFCNKNRTRLKILEWGDDGFWLHIKRLERGKFTWPGSEEENQTMMLSPEELNIFIGGTKIYQKLKRNEVKTGSVS